MGSLLKEDANTKISIIISIYNAENTLHKCISSVLDQSYYNLQIILIDDGSTDNSAQICEQFGLKDHRIEIYHTGNKGCVAARKLGLKIAKGNYIGFVDADDYVDSDMFYELLKIIIRADADFVHSGYISEKEGKKTIICNFEEKEMELSYIQEKTEFLKKYILEGNKTSISPSIWSKLFKADFIKACYKNLEDEQQYGEDFICLFRCILESKRVVLHKRAMYHYRVNGNSLSHIDSDEYMIKETRLWHSILKVLEEYQCLESVKVSMFHFLKRRMVQAVLETGCWEWKIPQFYFKDIGRLEGKRIVIFGSGRVGQDYYAQISKYGKCSIAAWADSNWDKYHFESADVIDMKNISGVLFDMVIIAVNSEKTGLEMREELIKLEVDEKKILWQPPGKYF